MKKGWIEKKLGEVCEFEGGSQPPKTLFSKEKKENYVRLIQIRDYKTDKHIVYIPKEKARRFCNEDDIMIGRYGPPVFQILKGLKGAYNVALMKAIPNEQVISKDYLRLFLKYSKIQDYIIHLSQRAAGQTGVNKKALVNYSIPLPPLSEQQEIVEILDEALEGIATIKANTQRNLQNARELFQSYLQGIFSNPGDDWEVKKLGEICIVERGSSPRPIKNYLTFDGSGVNWIKIGDTKGLDKYIYTTKEKITEDGAKQSRFVKEGDFILSNSMSFGKPYIMKTTGYIHDGWFVLRLPEYINTDYFYYLIISPFVRMQFDTLASGAIVKNISGDLVKKVKLPIPPLLEQQEIVAKLDALSAETKRLELIYQKKLNDLEELKKSILQKAFNGELTKNI